PMIQGFIGVDWRFSNDEYILFALATFIFFYGGWPFITGAFDELKDKNPGMMTLIGLAILVAYVYSSLTVFRSEERRVGNVTGVQTCALPISPMIQGFIGVDWRFSNDEYILFALATFIFFYGGWPFITGAFDELKDKNPGMMTLIGLAILVAYVYSSLTVF